MYALTAIDYIVEAQKPVVCLFARDECHDRKVFKVKGIKPYYYKLDDDKGTFPTIDGHLATKIECQLPSDVGRDRERYSHTYESDILFPLRFLVDRGIRYGFDIKEEKVVPADFKGLAVRPLFLDVEVEVTDLDIFPDPRQAKWMLLAVHLWIPIDGNPAMWRFEINNEEEEREFLEFLIQIFEEFDPDVITAYNVFFDLATIIGRMRHHKIDIGRLSPLGRVRLDDRYDDIHISGRNVFDYYAGYKKYKHKTLPSYKLEDIAYDECGIPVSDFPLDKMNRKYVPEVADYNMLDVFRMQMLDQKLTVIEFYDNIRQVVGCTYNEVMEASKYVDMFLLRYAYGRFVLPRKAKGNKKLDYAGAIVLKPERGVHLYTVMLDFSKMYPSILISYNISPETLRTAKPKEPHYTLPIGLKFKDADGKPYVEWREVYYLKDPPGFLPEIARDLISLREAVQKEAYKQTRGSPEYELLWYRQDALKVVLDAMYGVFAYINFRLFQPYISASMTGQGQQLAKRTITFMESKGYRVAYCDTDGLYFPLDHLTEISLENDRKAIAEGERMTDMVNQFWQDIKDEYNLYQAPKLKCEYVFQSLMLAKKKRYSAVIIYDNGEPCNPELKVVGFETRRCLAGSTQLIISDGDYTKRINASDLPSLQTQKWNLLTEQGFKPIKNVWVNKTNSTEMVQITLLNKSTITVTKSHKFQTQRGLVAANHLKLTDSIPFDVTPITQNKNVGTYDLGWLIGLILADGAINNQLTISLSPNEMYLAKKAKNIIQQYFGIKVNITPGLHYNNGNTKQTYIKVQCFSEPFKNFLAQFITGATCYNKHLTSYAYNTSEQFKRGVIKGLFDGDGCKKTKYIGLASKLLIRDISHFCALTGQLYSLNKIENRYGIRFCNYKSPRSAYNRLPYQNNVIQMPIISIEQNKAAKRNTLINTYDIEIDSPTHLIRLANGIITHNSDSAKASVTLQKQLFKMIHSFEGKEAIVDYIKAFAAKVRKMPLADIGLPCPLKTPIKAMKNVARVKSIVYSNQYLGQKIEVGSRPLEFYIKTRRLSKEDKKIFGFRDKPSLQWGLPEKFTLWTWSPKAESYVNKEYIADRVAFKGKVPEEWRTFIDMDVMVEKAVYNKCETILTALGLTEEERIELYGSKRPIKKEKEG